MKSIFLAILMIIVVQTAAYSQIDCADIKNYKTIDRSDSLSICVPTINADTTPQFVFIRKERIFFSSENVADNNPLQFIEPDWIYSITVFREKEAVTRYGPWGKNGIVFIYLSTDSTKGAKLKAFEEMLEKYIRFDCIEAQ